MRSAATGEEFYEIDFRLVATFQGGTIYWKLIFQGKEYGSTTISYEDA